MNEEVKEDTIEGAAGQVINAGVIKFRPTNYTLDTFYAPKLSQLTECGAHDMSHLTKSWLTHFRLNTTYRFQVPDPDRQYFFNFLRRVEAAFSEYNSAYSALYEYVTTERNVISPYYLALFHFETFLAQVFQSILFVESKSGQKSYQVNDGSLIDRVRLLYNTSKHMNERIEKKQLPANATLALWITNRGIESEKHSVTFQELEDLLAELSDLASQTNS